MNPPRFKVVWDFIYILNGIWELIIGHWALEMRLTIQALFYKK